jgi:hypothetical protein
MPPTHGFGWTSLCDSVRVPIEGEHFELDEDVTPTALTCNACQSRLAQSLDDDSIAGLNGCAVRFERDDDGMLVQAERLCQHMLHHSLPFEPESFTGNLAEQVEDVCQDCWETYVDHQWAPDDEGTDLRVEILDGHGRSEYFAAKAVPARRGHEGVVRLVSENGLQHEIHPDEIESITVTPHQNINY